MVRLVLCDVGDTDMAALNHYKGLMHANVIKKIRVFPSVLIYDNFIITSNWRNPFLVVGRDISS